MEIDPPHCKRHRNAQVGFHWQATKDRQTTHQTLNAEVVIRYSFHPRVGERFRIVRRHTVHDEICFVLHPVDANPAGALPLAVPAWMTEEASAHHEVVSMPRIPVTALVTLRGLVDLILSSPTPIVGEGGSDGSTQDSTAGTVRRRTTGCSTATAKRTARRTAEAANAVAVQPVPTNGSGERR